MDRRVRSLGGYKKHTTAFPDQLLFLSHTGRGQKGQAPCITNEWQRHYVISSLDKVKEKSD